MKKLLVVASIMAAVFTSEASSFSWGFTGYDYVNASGEGYDSDFDLNVWGGGKAYLYLGTVTASDTAFDFSAATLITSATFDAQELIYGNVGSEAYSTSDLVTSTDAGQAFSLILVDDTSKDLASYEGNYVLYTGLSEEGAIPGATVSYYAAFQDTNPVTQADWQTMGGGASPIPEPTSGLLMLLGMAGLALRRRRA